MPKMKTHSGAKKRFSKTKSGKIKRKKAYHRHLLTHKKASKKRKLRKTAYIHSCDVGHLSHLVP